MAYNFHDVLVAELAARKKLNSRFSLRAFARLLTLSPGQLSSIMSGKKPVTRRSAGKILAQLSLSSEDRAALLASLMPEFQVPVYTRAAENRLLKEDEFAVISDWYHYAILSLASVSGSRACPKWISRRLGITEIQALDALKRLKRLNLIRVEKDGRYRQSEKPLRTTNDVHSQAIRNHQKQYLDLAKEKIDIVPLNLREYGSVTIATNTSKMCKAKHLIREFKDRLANELVAGKADAVYTCSIQFFPVSEIEGTA